jgi:hypothetical protein
MNGLLKGTVSRDFCCSFFSWIIFPQAHENNTRVISIFSQKFAEIFTGQGAPPVSTTPAANFAKSSAGVVSSGGKFATGVNDTSGNLPPVSTTLAANLPLVANNGKQYQTADNLKWTGRKKFISMLTLLPIGVQRNNENFFDWR